MFNPLEGPMSTPMSAPMASRKDRPACLWVDKEPENLMSALDGLLAVDNMLRIEQFMERLEVIIGWEVKNQYRALDSQNRLLAHIVERSDSTKDVLQRMFLGSSRPFHVEVLDRGGQQIIMDLRRPFAFFFSHLTVETPTGRKLGSIKRVFSVIYRKYELRDDKDRLFGEIKGPFWKPWTFEVFGPGDKRAGQITKKWSGLFQEAFSKADNFAVDFGAQRWTLAQRAVIFAAAISIDFDYFEKSNDGTSGFLN